MLVRDNCSFVTYGEWNYLRLVARKPVRDSKSGVATVVLLDVSSEVGGGNGITVTLWIEQFHLYIAILTPITRLFVRSSVLGDIIVKY